MDPVKLFYSWQSDTDSKVGRNFIQKALEIAISEVSAERGVDIELDRDTLGVPGTPPVSDTILRKIRDCDIFVGDVTFVGETPAGKKLPNPNVLGEYGYALHARGNSRIILVMNAIHGLPDELPFDLRNLRHPAAYLAADTLSDPERRKIRRQFADKLVTALRETAKFAIAERSNGDDATADRLEHAITSMLERWGRNDVPGIVSEPRLQLMLIPHRRPDGGRLHPALVSQHLAALRPEHVLEQRTADSGPTSWWIQGPAMRVGDRPNPERNWYVRVHSDGSIDAALTIARRIDDDPDIGVDGRTLEARIVDLLDRISLFLGKAGLGGDATAHIQLLGCDDLCVLDGVRGGRRLREYRVMPGSITLRGIGNPVGNQLEPLLNALWMAAGRAIGSPSFVDGRWIGYDGGEGYASR